MSITVPDNARGPILELTLPDTGRQPLIEVGGYARGIAINATYIYWTNFTTGTIGRAKLDGTSVEKEFIKGTKGCNIRAIDVDATYIYWVQGQGGGSRGVYRAKLNGTEIVELFARNAVYAIAVDETHIYFPEVMQGESRILSRASLGGTTIGNDLTDIVLLGPPTGIAVDGPTVYVVGGTQAFGGSGYIVSARPLVLTLNDVKGPQLVLNVSAEISSLTLDFWRQTVFDNDGTDWSRVIDPENHGLWDSDQFPAGKYSLTLEARYLVSEAKAATDVVAKLHWEKGYY